MQENTCLHVGDKLCTGTLQLDLFFLPPMINRVSWWVVGPIILTLDAQELRYRKGQKFEEKTMCLFRRGSCLVQNLTFTHIGQSKVHALSG